MMRRISSLPVTGLMAIGLTCAAGCGSSDDGTTGQSAASDMMGGDTNQSNDPEIDPRNGYPVCPDNPDDYVLGEPCSDEHGAVICAVDTGYPGDELALCDRPDEVLRLHYGPDESEYDNPDALEPYLLGAGQEDEECMFVTSANKEEAFLSNYHGRMRPQSHHLIVTTLDQSPGDSEVPEPCQQTEVVGSRWLAGSQDPQIDVATGGQALGEGDNEAEPGDPDYGLATRIAPESPVRIDLHYINTTDEPIMREAWLTFDYRAEEEVETLVDMITFYQGDINVPPKSTSETAVARCEAPTDRYVGLVTGHFHENGLRFTVWKEDMAGQRDVVYETFDWADPGNLYYRDGVENPQPNEATGSHGGHSGYLHLNAGEALLFQCEFSNPTDEVVTLGDQGRDQMCNVFGMYYPSDGDVWSCACAGEGCF